MRLDALAHAFEAHSTTGLAEREVTGIAYDSRRVKPGDLFFALPGRASDGATFAAQAFERGAVAVVTEAALEAAPGPVLRVPDARLALAQAACEFHAHPSRTLAVVAVTGTNGKTTTTYMLESIFREAGLKPGVIGTTGIRLDGESRPSAFTTPEAPELQATLAEMRDRGVQAVAIEASSHALAQRRTWGLECDACAFTNLTQDHLDFHGTMDAYLDAKLMLFDGRNGPTTKPTTAVVNADDPSGERVAAAAVAGGMRVIRYGEEGGGSAPSARDDVWVENAMPAHYGLDLELTMPERPRGDVYVRLPLLGHYNAANAAAAIASAIALGIDQRAIVEGLEGMAGVPGRLELVDQGQAFQVVVDYAHTPDALERALGACRDHASRRVLLVFGCGGDRDRGKRPLMGGIAEQGADRVWVTNDNPRSEDPAAIARDITAGMTRPPRVVLDRREAISEAVAEAAAGDLVLIAGKGHETTQLIGARVLPFDDREAAREALRARAGAGR